MQHFTFNLAVKAYIKKFIYSQYGHPVVASLDTDIGFVVINTLASRVEYKVARGIYLDFLPNRLNDQITFIIPFHYWSITRKEISKYTAVLLNRYFETKFEEALYNFVKTNCAVDHDKRYVGYKQAIEKFADDYDIVLEHDVQYETLKKMEFRLRKKKSEKSSRILSPQLQHNFAAAV